MKTYLTQKDFDKVTAELAEKERRVGDLTLKLGEAAKKSGSFVASNPEFTSVKSQIDTLQTVVDSFKKLLADAEVREIDSLPNQVTNYSLVEAKNTTDGENYRYYIQIPILNLQRHKDTVTASPESPLGKALYGKKIGDEVIVELPSGKMDLKVLNIQKI